MQRPDSTFDQHAREASARTDAPSKTRRKAQMHALQSLGEALVELKPSRLAELELPERLAEAIADARGISKWEAKRRQLQFIGRLMRDIDPQPIGAKLAQWASGEHAQNARFHDVEAWRDELLKSAAALDRLCAHAPQADRAAISALVARAREERERSAPPHAYRQLFRVLATLLAPKRDE